MTVLPRLVLVLALVAWSSLALPEREIEAALADPGLKGMHVGVSLRRFADGREVYTRRAAEPLVLASCSKLFTTAAALVELGPDFEARTVVALRGRLRTGQLEGDVVVLGGGDPDLSGRFHGDEPRRVLASWAAKLAQLGLRRVSGKLIGDATAFRGPAVHETWPADQRDRWYEAPVAGLSINDGCVDVTVKPGPQAGASAVVKLSPEGGSFKIVNHCITTAKKSEHQVVIAGRPGTGSIEIRGAILAGSEGLTHPVAVDDPARFCLEVLLHEFKRAGIEVAGGLALAAEPVGREGLMPVAASASYLGQMAAVCNKRSQNLYAEMIFRHLGRQRGGEGSFSGGAKALLAFARGLGLETVVLQDGSGMSEGNRSCAADLTKLLVHMAKLEEPAGPAFVQSLPVSGQDGSLERRLSGPQAAGKVWAKTGTIDGVSTLAGYVCADGSPRYAFAILMNKVGGRYGQARAAQDRICEALVREAGASDAR